MSSVWAYFEPEKSGRRIVKAKCKQCNKPLHYGTNGMKAHLATHGIEVSIGQKASSEDTSQRPVTDFFHHQEKDSLNGLLARLCAKDGLPFSVIANSKDISEMINSKGIGKCPSSDHTIRKHVAAFAEEIKQKYIAEMQEAKNRLGLLSLSFDEWTSVKNRRYMSLLVHLDTAFWDLGLIRIRGKTNYLLSKKDIETRLTDFGLELKDFVALMSDGAPINAAIAREAGLCQQQCLAHAIHLAVSDLLYDTSLSSQVNSTEDSSDKEEDEVEDELSSPYFIQVFLEDKSLIGHWNYFTPPTQKSIRKNILLLVRLLKRNSTATVEEQFESVSMASQSSSTSDESFYDRIEAKRRKRTSTGCTLEQTIDGELEAYNKSGFIGSHLQQASTQLGHCAQLRAAASGPSVWPDTSVIDSDLDSETTL